MKLVFMAAMGFGLMVFISQLNLIETFGFVTFWWGSISLLQLQFSEMLLEHAKELDRLIETKLDIEP